MDRYRDYRRYFSFIRPVEDYGFMVVADAVLFF